MLVTDVVAGAREWSPSEAREMVRHTLRMWITVDHDGIGGPKYWGPDGGSFRRISIDESSVRFALDTDHGARVFETREAFHAFAARALGGYTGRL